MKKYFLFLCLIISGWASGQTNGKVYYQGFVEEVEGKRFSYHSPFPEITASLLLRGQEDYKPIEWKTEAVPENYSEKYITFMWLFAMDVSS